MMSALEEASGCSQELLGWARSAVQAEISGSVPRAPACRASGLGCFVTLKIGHSLRGCIGYPVFRGKISECVRLAALGAAFGDPRFPPLTQPELETCTFELTLLGPPKPLDQDALRHPKSAFTLGRHALLVTRGRRSGLLLPQVATELGLDEIGFLEATCIKAGLTPDSWMQPDTKVYILEGRWVSEKEPGM